MKVLLSLVVLTLLGSGGCCLNADNCTEAWVRDAAEDAPVDLGVGGGEDARGDVGPMSMLDGGGDAVVDAMVDAMPDAMPECASNMTCAAKDEKAPFCDKNLESGSCRDCREDMECNDRSDGKRACSKTGATKGRCVECNTSAECSNAQKPFCDPEAHACRPCVQDTECGDPGICLDHLGGRCATPNEVLYVELNNNCGNSNSEIGTRANPFCTPTAAIEEAKKSAARRVIVLTGTTDVASFSVALGVGESLTVIGKGPALVAPQDRRPSVELTQGTLYLRGLTVRNSAVSAGISADGPDSTLVVLRSFVHHNADGGIKIGNKAAFTIKDTVVSENGKSGSSLASGIFVQGPAIAKAKRVLQNVSVLNNAGFATGLFCESEVTASGLLAFSGAEKSVSDGCSVANCCAAPKFNAMFKLQSTSPMDCFGQVPAAKNTLDVFGQLRLGDGDCGADQKDVP